MPGDLWLELDELEVEEEAIEPTPVVVETSHKDKPDPRNRSRGGSFVKRNGHLYPR